MTTALYTGILLLGTLTINAAQEHDSSPSAFASFVAKHGRQYKANSSEYQLRHKLFVQRAIEVDQHNSKPERLWTAKINHLADRTDSELAQLRGWRGVRSTSRRSVAGISPHMHGRPGMFLSQRSNSVGPRLPEEISWGNLSSIQADTNQGGCGSCWAIAATTVLNSAAEKAGLGRTFSEQDLVDCVPNPHHCGGTGGCSGATVELAMNFVVTSGVRDTSRAPYFGVDHACAASLLQTPSQEDFNFDSMVAVGVHTSPAASAGMRLGLKAWERLPENEYEPLLHALVQHGPVAISVAASSWSFYNEGIFDSCSKDAVIDHAVTLFGYGKDAASGRKFWEIKNSWGLGWGMQGNIRLLREDAVTCGTDWQPEVGTGCDGGPTSVTVCGHCGILYDAVSVQM